MMGRPLHVGVRFCLSEPFGMTAKMLRVSWELHTRWSAAMVVVVILMEMQA
jgi:hypothetical protein